MKKYFVFLLCIQLSALSFGQIIIADHTVVDKYDDIPQYYINEVKKMWLVNAGESHSYGIRWGLQLLENIDAKYAVNITDGIPWVGTNPAPEAYTTTHLRASGARWGDYDNASGWIYWHGEEDWFTNATAVSRTKASIAYCDSHNLTVSALTFGWCWDPMGSGPTASVDPVYGVHWWGSSVAGPSGDKAWGLDAGDYAITNNLISMQTYLDAMKMYADYCTTNNIPTKVFFATGPVDNYNGNLNAENMYQAHLKYEYIRDYIDNQENAILFDYADILCYDNNGALTTTSWNGHPYPTITNTNSTPQVEGHISAAGELRLGKAMWWMLARIAGWDGTTGSTWLGGTTDWKTATNWSSGSVPGPATNVVIPDVTKEPHVTIPDAQCKDLTVNASSGLHIDAGRALTINGNLINNGTLTIESASPVSSGSLIVNGSSTGNVTYNRIMPADKYRYVSSPVSAASLPSGNSFWRWNEPLGVWGEDITETPTTTTASGLGYTMLTSGNTVSFIGSVVNSASQTATAPYNSYSDHYADQRTSSGGQWGGGGWNLLGNPFTSAMNVIAFIDRNNGIIDGSQEDNSFDPSYEAVYIYNGSDYYYITSGNTGYEGLGSFPTYTDIQAGQGFFVLANYNNVTFSFTPEMRIHNTLTPMTKSAKAEVNPWPGLQLKVKYGARENSTLIVYNEKMNAGLDPGYDVGQLSTGPEVEIYTSLVEKGNNVNFAQQALPMTDLSKNIVFVGIDSENGGEVTFSAFTVPLGNNKFWLEDRTTGIFTDLNFKSYTVTLPAKTYGTGRFFIYTSANTPTGISGQPEDTEVRIWTSQGKVIIRGPVSKRATVAVYDLQGNKVLEALLPDEALNTVALPSGSHGVYLVRIVDGAKTHIQKVVFL